jgi:hypothetical protein
MAAAAHDAARYAESLRRELIEGLGIGDLDGGASDGSDGEGYSGFGAGQGPPGGGASGLRDLDRELEAFEGHEVIKDILDQGHVPKEYARGIDDRLRAAELESIQDYIAESDNLVALHGQVGRGRSQKADRHIGSVCVCRSLCTCKQLQRLRAVGVTYNFVGVCARS